MFSGIIERLATVRGADLEGGSLRLTIDTGYSDLELGESVAVNGVCLTVVSTAASGVTEFFVSSETLDRSNIGGLTAGGLVNLERSVRLETRLSGHMVQGHVDGQATLVAIAEEAGATGSISTSGRRWAAIAWPRAQSRSTVSA